MGQAWDPSSGLTGAFVNAIDVLADMTFYELPASCTAGTPASDSFDVELTEDNLGRFRFGWQIKDDTDRTGMTPDYRRTDVGDSQITPQQVSFNLIPPVTCTAPLSAPVQVAVDHGPLGDYYDVLTCVLRAYDPSGCLEGP